MKKIIAFERGWRDATSIEDSYQYIEVDLDTCEISTEGLLFKDYLPNLDRLNHEQFNVNDLINLFHQTGWILA